MEYASDEDKITALRTLAKETTNEAEKLLFETAVQEIKEQGFDGIKTKAVYTQYFSHIENPKYPFIEVCNLPILFKKGDVITAVDGKTVSTTQEINEIRGEIGDNIFQRSFHDHIIRGEKDYNEICYYIEKEKNIFEKTENLRFTDRLEG